MVACREVGLESHPPLPQLPAAEGVTGDFQSAMGWYLVAFSGLPQNIFLWVCSVLWKSPDGLQTREAWGAWPYFELPAERLEGAMKSSLHSCSSVWGWAQLQSEMGTGHVHGTVASPWECAVVPIRGKGELKAPQHFHLSKSVASLEVFLWLAPCGFISTSWCFEAQDSSGVSTGVHAGRFDPWGTPPGCCNTLFCELLGEKLLFPLGKAMDPRNCAALGTTPKQDTFH